MWPGDRARLVVCRMSLSAMLLAFACNGATARVLPGDGRPVDAAAASALRSAGPRARLAVLPTRLGDRAVPQVAEVIAVLLERAGMQHLEVAQDAFMPAASASAAASDDALCEFVKLRSGAADFVLFTELEGSRPGVLTGVTGVVVDRTGRVAWSARMHRGDSAFDRAKPREPMDACVLLSRELGRELDLSDPTRANTAEGPIARQMRSAAGVPDREELARIEKRAAQLQRKAGQASMLVYTPRCNGATCDGSATTIAAALTDACKIQAVASDHGPALRVPATMNQQQLLWTVAREASAYIRQHRPDIEYVLVTYYIMQSNDVRGVQFVICDAEGQIVVAELHNSHSKAFQAVTPRDARGCDQLVASRVASLIS